MENKIGFYCNFDACTGKTIGDLSNQNPGIGGTQYLFLLLYQILKDKYGDKIFLFSNVNVSFDSIDYKVDYISSDINKIIQYCEIQNIKILIIREFFVQNIIVYSNKLDIYVWAHNTINRKMDIIISKNEMIKKLICVSKTQAYNMSGYKCNKKVCYINNCIPDSNNIIKNKNSDKNALYIGALVPQKGCNETIKIWKKVIKKHPTSKLFIIGGASVRGLKNTGIKGLAEKRYEKKILKTASSIKQNVVFCGSCSSSMIKEISDNCLIGIPNPSNFCRDETFCLSAVEMQRLGLNVVSKYHNNGYINSIGDSETGFLYKTNKLIAKKIVSLLDNPIDFQKAIDFSMKFSVCNFTNDWISLLCEGKSNLILSANKKCRYIEYFLCFIDLLKIKVLRYL